MNEPTITREEWTRRYAARIMKCAGWTLEQANEAARVGALEHERNERAAGNAVIWSGSGFNSPEDEADTEMSYWEDDGDSQ